MCSWDIYVIVGQSRALFPFSQDYLNPCALTLNRRGGLGVYFGYNYYYRIIVLPPSHARDLRLLTTDALRVDFIRAAAALLLPGSSESDFWLTVHPNYSPPRPHPRPPIHNSLHYRAVLRMRSTHSNSAEKKERPKESFLAPFTFHPFGEGLN